MGEHKGVSGRRRKGQESGTDRQVFLHRRAAHFAIDFDRKIAGFLGRLAEQALDPAGDIVNHLLLPVQPDRLLSDTLRIGAAAKGARCEQACSECTASEQGGECGSKAAHLVPMLRHPTWRRLFT